MHITISIRVLRLENTMRNLNPPLQSLLARFDGQVFIPFSAEASRKLISQKKFQFVAPQKRYSLHLSPTNRLGEYVAIQVNHFTLQEVR